MMDRTEVVAFLTKQLAELTGRRESEFTASANLVENGVLDSMAAVNMILLIDEEYEVTIYPDQAGDLVSIDVIADFIIANA